MKPGLIGRLRKRALPLLLLAAANGSFAALPVPADGSAVLRVQGSNTVGAKLAPMLIAGLFEAEGFQDISIQPTEVENEQRVSARTRQGKAVIATVAAHGTGTGFAGLKNGQGDLAAASRPIENQRSVPSWPNWATCAASRRNRSLPSMVWPSSCTQATPSIR